MNKQSIFYLLLFPFLLFGQKIASVQLYSQNAKDFGSFIFQKGTKFFFSFDDLDDKTNTYFYTITHHDANWQKSKLLPIEYLKGNQQTYLSNYTSSFNTQTKYKHYQFSIPDENTQLLISGNYMIHVFKDSDHETPIIERKICLYENKNPLKLTYFREINSSKSNQRIQVELYKNEDFVANFNTLKLFTIQNNNFDSTKEYTSPFIQSKNILYNAFREVFEGANEYYFFDTRMINVNGFSTYKIEKIDGITHVYLMPNTNRSDLNYTLQNDINGSFAFGVSDTKYDYDQKNSADYVWVHFYFLSNDELPHQIYVVGGFNNWQGTEENKMRYNTETNRYELALLLKQGYFNYTFATNNNNNNNTLDYAQLNGSFWQTENNYKSLLYFRPFGGRYDQLLGYGEFGQQK